MTSSDAPGTGNEYINVLAEMTEKITERTLSTINRSQQALIEVVANWAQTTQRVLPQPSSAEALQALPKPTELVDRGFEIAEQLLRAQHSFAKRLMESAQGLVAEAAADSASVARNASDTTTASTSAATGGAAHPNDSITQTVKRAFSKSDAPTS